MSLGNLSSSINLKVVDLQNLLKQDEGEDEKIFQAVKEEGFFYLDFRRVDQSGAMLDMVERLFNFQESLFNLSVEEKMKYDVDILSHMKLNGYIHRCSSRRASS